MKIKGVIKDLNFFFNLKSDNSKNISRNFSGAVEGSVGSVQFWMVSCSSLYFSRSAPSSVVGVKYRVLICCSCHFQSGSLCFFWLLLFASLFSV